MMKYFSSPLLDNAEGIYKKTYEDFIVSSTLQDAMCGRLPHCGYCSKNKSVRIEKVIFNDPATIVFWNDGTKTVVKAENEPFDREKGLAMAISKKVLGNKGNYFETFKKFIKEGE